MCRIPGGMYIIHALALLMTAIGIALILRGAPFFEAMVMVLWIPLVVVLVDIILLWEVRWRHRQFPQR